MSLTRKFLSALGIEPEKVDEIITAHTETVNALKEERDKYRVDAEKLPDVQSELDKAKEDLEKTANDGFKQKYDDLKVEFDNYKSAQAQKDSEAKKANAYRELLKQAGVSEKRLDAVMKVTALDGIEFAEDGTLTDSEKLLESIKTEWSDFIEKIDVKGADVHNPPANNGGNTFESMSLTEKMAYANEHPRDQAVLDWLRK